MARADDAPPVHLKVSEDDPILPGARMPQRLSARTDANGDTPAAAAVADEGVATPPVHPADEVELPYEVPDRERAPAGVLVLAAIITALALVALFWFARPDDAAETGTDTGTVVSGSVDESVDQAPADEAPSGSSLLDELTPLPDSAIADITINVDRCTGDEVTGTIRSDIERPVAVEIELRIWSETNNLISNSPLLVPSIDSDMPSLWTHVPLEIGDGDVPATCDPVVIRVYDTAA